MPLRDPSLPSIKSENALTIHKTRPTRTDAGAASEAIALQALAWVLSDPARAERLLSLTGLTPDDLRQGLTERRVQAAILEFLTQYEPDLIAAADALDVAPETIAVAAAELAR